MLVSRKLPQITELQKHVLFGNFLYFSVRQNTLSALRQIDNEFILARCWLCKRPLVPQILWRLMKPEPAAHASQDDLFKVELISIIGLQHRLVKLASLIP
jgi:hypothetical protein